MAKKPETEQQTSTGKPNGSAQSENRGPEFAIQRVYVKDLSLEAPNSPQVFQQSWQPRVDVQLNTNAEKLADNVYGVDLTITVTAKTDEKVAFLVEVKQAGIFSIAGLNETQMKHTLGSYCPNVLFPFAREMVADLIGRGGFPPLYLAPINFDALYEQQQKQQTGTTASAEATTQQ